MKTILILSNTSYGLFKFRHELLQDMKSYAFVHISLPQEDDYYNRLRKEGFIMHLTPFERRGMNPVRDMELLKSYKELLIKVKPEVVCTYTIKPCIYGGMACRRMNIPTIMNITGLGTAIENGGALSVMVTAMYRQACKSARTVFFQNDSNMQFFNSKRIGVGKSKLLPGSGVNYQEHKYIPMPGTDKGINVLAVIRIMRDKGIGEYLYAADRLGGKDNIHFLLVGDFEEAERSVYEPVINRLIEEGKIMYLGYKDDIDSAYGMSHIVVHPSYHEGLSNVCLEAASCGRPVITTDVSGCRETIQEGVTGVLVRPRDKEALVSAINKMISSGYQTMENMGMRGRQYVIKNFDRQQILDSYRSVLNEI